MRLRACALSWLFLGMLLAGCNKNQSASSTAPKTNTSAGSPVAVSPTEPVVTAEPIPEPTPATPVPIAQTTATSPIGNPLTMPSMGRDLSDSQRDATRVLDLASLNQAIQMFYVEEDRYPKSLDELVEKKYYARLPAPPRGSYYQYNPETGHLRIVQP